jgi:hypothetical protein
MGRGNEESVVGPENEGTFQVNVAWSTQGGHTEAKRLVAELTRR